MLRLDSVKFFADGGMTSATAAVEIPYKETGTNGILIYETEYMAELMWEAHEAGFWIATHANGDRALEQSSVFTKPCIIESLSQKAASYRTSRAANTGTSSTGNSAWRDGRDPNSDDPLATPTEALTTLVVEQSYVAGRLVYAR